MGSRKTARPAGKRNSSYITETDSSPSKRLRIENAPDGKENNGAEGSTIVAAREQQLQASSRDSLLADRHRNEQGKPPEAGVIREIYVENFMCHKKLRVPLCRNVNFIHGQNGSGKSAILAAIQICLGAGARRTHRARNLKDLVRKDSDCNAAKVRVTLLNRGDDAYQHDVYGDTITVERTIAMRGGYNGYKLYSDNMEEISRNKKDLDEMLDKLNIQVENPCAILDQEDAKKFLTGKAEDKYEFFMRATELERLDRKYAATIDMVRDLDNQSTRLNNALQTYIDQASEAKKRHKEFKRIEELETKKESCEELYAWSKYFEANGSLTQHIEERDGFQAKAQRKLDELSQAEEAAQGPDDEETNRRNNLERLAREAEEQSKQKRPHSVPKSLGMGYQRR
jgi:chromosome segregation ATPase